MYYMSTKVFLLINKYTVKKTMYTVSFSIKTYGVVSLKSPGPVAGLGGVSRGECAFDLDIVCMFLHVHILFTFSHTMSDSC